jgi:hypothetical protein
MRGGKKSAHRAGIRTPITSSMGGHVKVRRGKKSR